jgi:hypothetical protein
MSRRILGIRSTNWDNMSTGRARRGPRNSRSLSKGEYEWDIMIFDSNDNRRDDRTIRADSFDEAVEKAMNLIQYGERVTVDGRSFTK